MSVPTTIEQVPISWRKRSFPDDEMDPYSKRARYYFRLASETSHSSEDDTESFCSIQDKETDAVKDTSDTEARTDGDSEYEVQVEYDVASATDEDLSVISSSGEEDIVMAAAAALCNNPVDAFITDVEDSDTSSVGESTFSLGDFTSCVKCKRSNDNPGYRYCNKCFQDRKTFFPPRPRRKRSRPNRKKSPVKLATLRSCLSGLSQDSGLGSSQDCPPLNLDQIVVPKHLTENPSQEEHMPSCSQATTSAQAEADQLKNRKRAFSESSLSDFDTAECPRPKQMKTSSNVRSKNVAIPQKQKSIDVNSKSDCLTDMCEVTTTGKSNSVVNMTRSCPSISSTASVSTPSVSSVGAEDKSKEKENQSKGTEDQSKAKEDQSKARDDQSRELCIVCNATPKNGIFIHGSIAHMCCCYQCAMRTWRTIKRCPICSRRVNNVVKLYT